jgi:hypothetical protein
MTSDDDAGLMGDFFEAFLGEFDGFRLKQVSDEPFDDAVTKLIEQMKPLRDIFAQFAQRLARARLTREDHDELHDYLEKIAQFQFLPAGVSYYHEYDWDNFRFLCYELFTILIAVLIKRGKYADAAAVVDSTYFYESNTDRHAHAGIDLFNNYNRSLDDVRNRRLQLRRVSVTADLIKERAEGSAPPFSDLVTTDIMLHYLTFLRANVPTVSWQSEIWFPRLSPYSTHHDGLPILRKLSSARHFERVKILFGVDTPGELKQLIERAMDEKSSYYQAMSTFDFPIPNLMRAIPLGQLATMP